VVTSGRGGVLPPGLAIGTVASIADGAATVEPLVDFTRLEYLRLLEYARVVPPEQLEELQQEIYGPPLPPGFVAPEPPVPHEPLAGDAGPRHAAAVPAPALERAR